MAKSKRTNLKNQVWKYFSRYIRLRDAIATTKSFDSVQCITCNSYRHPKGMDAGHFVSRRHQSVLYDEKNVHAQCKPCNMEGGMQYQYGLVLEKRYGKNEVKRLMRGRNEIKKLTLKDLEELKELYKSKYKELTEKYGDPWK